MRELALLTVRGITGAVTIKLLIRSQFPCLPLQKSLLLTCSPQPGGFGPNDMMTGRIGAKCRIHNCQFLTTFAIASETLLF